MSMNMQSDFLLSDHSKCDFTKNTDNNAYKFRDKQHCKKKSSYYRSIQTPRLDSINGIILSDNLPGSSMSVKDITLTMSDDEGQNFVCLEQTASRLDSGVEDSGTNSSLFPSTLRQMLSPQDPSTCIPQCSNALCDSDVCVWHTSILKYPQHVRWKPNTATIQLERKSRSLPFGFTPKAKKYCPTDKHIEEIYVLVKKVEPGGCAAKAGLAVGDFVRSVNHDALYSEQEYNKFVNSTLRHTNKLMMQIQRPYIISTKDSKALVELTIDQKSFNPLAKTQSPCTSPDVKFSPCSPSAEAIPLRPVARSKSKSDFPQARLIVCGNRTNEFMQCFMGGFIQFPIESHASYHQVSLESRQNSLGVTVTNSKSFSCMVRESSSFQFNSVNVDIISVANDNFFHHCCPWICFPDSIFILTFDVKRLAQFSDVEMARLSTLKQTVNANRSGLSERLKLVGVVLPGEDVPQEEEIRTLFYTSLGKTLPAPDFVSISGTIRTKGMQLFQTEIFHNVTDMVSKSHVVVPTLNAMDCLISHQNLTITNQELASHLMNWNLEFNFNSNFLTSVIEDLKKTSNLLSTGHLPQFSAIQEYIIPSKLFDCLVHITMTTDKIHVPASGILPRSHLIDYFETFTSDPGKLLTCLEDLGVVYTIQVKGHDPGALQEIGLMFLFLLEELPCEATTAKGDHEILAVELSEPIASSSFLCWLSKLSRFCHRFKILGQLSAQFLLEGLDLTCDWNRIQNRISLLVKRPTTINNTAYVSSQVQQRVETALYSSLGTLRSPYYLHWTKNSKSGIRNKNSCVDNNTEDAGKYYVRGVNILDDDGRATLHELLDMDDGRGKKEAEMLNWLLDCAIVTVPHLTIPLRKLHQHLSSDNGWEVLASFLHQTTQQTLVFGSRFAANPNRLPAETFYIHFTQESFCCLSDILLGLLYMAESKNDAYCKGLAKNLLEAAVNGYDKNQCQS